MSIEDDARIEMNKKKRRNNANDELLMSSIQNLNKNNNNNADQSDDEDDDNCNVTKRSKSKTIIDYDGTTNVAYSSNDIEKIDLERLQKLSETLPSDLLKQQLLSTNNIDNELERRIVIQNDDNNPNLNNLNDKQKRSLLNKQKYIGQNNQKTNFRKYVDGKLERIETKRLKAAINSVQAIQILQGNTNEIGIIQAENNMESTMNLTQVKLKNQLLIDNNNSNSNTAKNIYNITLSKMNGPYGINYDNSGRYSSIYSKNNGHVAIMDNIQQNLITEFHLNNDKIRDIKFLHNYTLYAIAQKNHVYIYDNNGIEIHHLTDHINPMKLQYLKYHWLLSSIGNTGYLKYQDISTGKLISQHNTSLGSCNVLEQNVSNSIIHCGHKNGTVTLWSPNSSKFLIKMLCHKGSAITSMAIDNTGQTMVTAGTDKQIKIWDLRMLKEKHSYYTVTNTPATSLDISQRNMLAISHSSYVTIWNSDALQQKVKVPYMQHQVNNLGGNGPIHNIKFRPYEDVCGVGHASGYSSIVIPGSGEPTIDTSEYNTNPYQDTKQRREAEVRSLLDKLNPNMIMYDNPIYQVGGIEESNKFNRLERLQELEDNANDNDDIIKKKNKGKRRGRSKTQSQLNNQNSYVEKKLKKKINESNIYEKIINDVMNDNDDNTNDNNEFISRNNDKNDNTNDDSNNTKKLKKKKTTKDNISATTIIQQQPIKEQKESAPPALKRFF